MKKLSIVSISLLSVLNLFLPSPSHGAIKKALLIGINNYKNLPFYSIGYARWIRNLKGPTNDIRIMKEVLTSHYGFRDEHIKILMDEKATRDNIIKTFESWLINGTKEGDLVLFYFSGHGTQVPDQNGDEDDGMDEALCPYDVMPNGARDVIESRLIIDDELGEMLRKIPSRDVVVIVDACHSGSVTRSIRRVPVSNLEETPAYQARFIPVEIDETRVRGRTFSLNIPRQDDIPEGQIFISSSREDQISLEIALPEGFQGALTSSLAEGMRARRDITYRELFEYAKKVVKDRYRLEQDPQIEPVEGKVLANMAFNPFYTIVSQVKPEDQKPQLPSERPPVPEKPSVLAPVKPQLPITPPPPKPPLKPQPAPQPVKPQESPAQVVKPPEIPPQVVKPSEPPTQMVKPSKPSPQIIKPPEPSMQVVRPQEQAPEEVKPETLPAPAPLAPEKPSSAPQPPPEIKGRKVLVRIDPIHEGDAGFIKKLKEKMAQFPYVEITEEDFFDRLIRAEVKKGEYHLRLLNHIGDVVKIGPAKSIDELIKLIAPHLEYAYIVKQLAHIHHPEPPFNVKISVTDDRRDFRIGEKIVFTISCEEDCYLLMLNLDSKGNFQVIYPNKFHKDNFVKAGRMIQIPDQEMKKRGFEFQFFPPTGEETVKLIATNKKMELGSINLSDFKEMFKNVSGSAMKDTSPSRGLVREIVTVIREKSEDKEFRWSEDTIVIRSH